jgi:hypothetical protein
MLCHPAAYDRPTRGAFEAAQLISGRLDELKSGALRFWGQVRPSNIHIVVGAEAEGDPLVIRFNEDEVLTVWQPGGFAFDASAPRGK